MLRGGGAVGALMRNRDWSASPLGDPEGWPQSLRSVVGLMLGSKFPMFVAWGPDLGFLYNDAYAEILGEKHPAALGGRFQDIWAEIWDDIWPLIEAAMAGEASFREDLPLTMNRRGYDEETWFTFSYSPVQDETGHVAGMFCAVTETTPRVRAERRQSFIFRLDERLGDLDDAAEILEAAAGLLGEHLGADRVHWGEVDESADRFHVRHEWTRGDTPSLKGAHRLSDFGEALIDRMRLGETIEASDVLAEPLASAESVASELGDSVRGVISVPLFRGNRWRMALCVHTRRPRRWQEDDAELAREAAHRAWTRADRADAEQQVRESEARFRALVNATSDVVYRMSPDWKELRQLDGRGFLADTERPSVAWQDLYLLPEDQPAVAAEIERAIAAKSPFQLEHRVRRADGGLGWTFSRAIPVLDQHGDIVEWFGTASDISDRKEAEEHLRLMVNELNHRVKNSLATVQAIAVQTLQRGEAPEEVREALVARLIALAEAHDVLTSQKWGGAELASLAEQAAAPYQSVDGGSPFVIEGPSLFLPPRMVIAMSLAFHELATNAAKYGALSAPGGRVEIGWRVLPEAGGRRLQLTWRESGGRSISPPARFGFGTRLIQRTFASEGGEVRLDYEPSGLVCVMEARLPDDFAEAWKVDLQLA